MANITFKKIVIKNFQSYGDIPTIFYFTKSLSTLITGANRAGKSTIIEGFVYALSGKSYRGTTLDRLINTINQKDCVVELYFEIDGVEYVIKRGMKPKIFSILVNGKSIDETASIKDMQKYLETHILKTSISGIISTSILGCSYKPFMAMSSKEKRDMVDTLLDVSDFGEMSALLKKKISMFKDELVEYQNQLKIAELEMKSKLALYEQAKSNQNIIINNDKDELKILAKKVKELESNINDKNKLLEDIKFEHDIQHINEKHNLIDKDIFLTNNNIKIINEKIKKFSKLGSVCTECGQDVSKEHTDEHIAKFNNTLVELKNKKIYLENEIKTYDNIKKEHGIYNCRITQLKNEISSYQSSLVDVKKMAMDKLKKHKNLNNNTDSLDNYKIEYDNSVESYQELIKKEYYYSKMKSVYLLASNLLKDDGIKSSIVNQYMPVLTQYINYYLKVLNFNITFNIDKNLEVRLDSRYEDEFIYPSLSMGERQRIDLAITFAWRKVASVKNSVSTNVLFMDETFDASIDAEGTDDLLTILEDFKRENVNVFVISHKGNLDDKLRSTINIVKRNGFSKILNN